MKTQKFIEVYLLYLLHLLYYYKKIAKMFIQNDIKIYIIYMNDKNI